MITVAADIGDGARVRSLVHTRRRTAGGEETRPRRRYMRAFTSDRTSTERERESVVHREI